MSFGFLPGDGQPDFEALLKQFSEMGIDSETISDAKSFIENIKPYGLNLPIVKSHYKKLAKQLLEEEEPSIINDIR